MRMVLCVLAGCVAPPIGIGRGVVADPAVPTIGIGVGGWDHRATAQLEGAVAVHRSPRFALDVGGVYTQLVDERAHGSLLAIGVMPYVQPRWRLGHVSVAVAGSAIALSAGEGGVLGGFADIQLGYRGGRWAVYGGGYATGCMVAETGPVVGALQLRAGAEAWFGASGIALELYRHVESLVDEQRAIHTDAVGLGAKLRVAW